MPRTPARTGTGAVEERDRSRAARRLPALLALLVFAGVVAAFVPALRAGFVNWDDPPTLLENPHIRGWSSAHLAWMFRTPYLGPYQPLSWLSLSLDHALWGLSGPEAYPEAWGYHLTSVLIHAAAAAIFTLFAARVLARALPAASPAARWLSAALAGLLFGAHPLRAESVAWVTERRDVLSGLFLALALWSWAGWVGPRQGGSARTGALALAALSSATAVGAFFLSIDLSRPDALALRAPGAAGIALALALLALSAQLAARAERGAPSVWRFHAALLWFLLSLLSKGTSMTLPLALLMLDVWPFRRWRAADGASLGARAAQLALEKSSWLGLSAIFATLALWGQRGQESALVSWAAHTPSERLLQCLYGLVWYPWKTLLPLGLVPLVELPPELSLRQARFLVPAVLVACAVPCLFALRRRAPALLASALAFALLAAPILGLAQAGSQLVADRYSYVACLPFALLLGGGLGWLATRRALSGRAALILGAAWALALGALTLRQAGYWRSSESLWQHALAVHPDSPAALQMLGLVRRDQVYAAPDPASKRARLHEARELFERGLALGGAPAFLAYLRDVHVRLAGLEPEAREIHAEQAIDCSRRFVQATEQRGWPADEARLAHAQLLLAFDRADQAVRQLERLSSERPGRADVWVALGAARLSAADPAGAVVALKQALRLDGSPASTWRLLAQASAEIGDRDGALAACREALERDPLDRAARELLSRLRAR